MSEGVEADIRKQGSWTAGELGSWGAGELGMEGRVKRGELIIMDSNEPGPRGVSLQLVHTQKRANL